MSSNLKTQKASKTEKASLAIQVYSAYQQKKTVQGLEKLQAKMGELADLEKISIGIQESSRQLIEEQNRISRATQNEVIKSNQIQNEILKAQFKNEEAIKIQTLKQEVQYQKEDLHREKDEIEKKRKQVKEEYIQAQINLTFDLRVSSEELDEGKNTNLEKYFLLGKTQDLLEMLDTDEFGISDKEYAYKVLKETKNRRQKAKDAFSKDDERDLKTIESIEAEDESVRLEILYANFQKFKEAKKELESLTSLSSTVDLDKDDLLEILKESNKAKKTIKKLLDEIKE